MLSLNLLRLLFQLQICAKQVAYHLHKFQLLNFKFHDCYGAFAILLEMLRILMVLAKGVSRIFSNLVTVEINL